MFNFEQILRELDERIEKENERRRADEITSYPKMKILLLGQMGLFAHPDELEAKLHLVGTADVDAKIQAEYSLVQLFEKVLEAFGLEYDRDSHLVWVPPESTQITIFETPRLKCDVVNPLYLLTSKAIKAKEKNRILIKQALKIYGRELESLIRQHGGDPNYFKK
ncbi:MAG TPA: hypothetical protein VI895_04245 [Bdellovibrionota bacterium]|nr:hypothetical protein [Bdellovibrionota bacterium]